MRKHKDTDYLFLSSYLHAREARAGEAGSETDRAAILRDLEPQRLWLHPDDAAARGIRDGDMVLVWNDRGSTRLQHLSVKKARTSPFGP